MEREARFYKLNKRKRYAAEGTRFKIGKAVLLGIVVNLFLALAIALAVINFDVLFRDAQITSFIFVFFAIIILISVVGCVKSYPVYKQRKHARAILKNCTLTDGTVIFVDKQKIQHYGTNYYSYYVVLIRYEYHKPDGKVYTDEHYGKYAEVPFFVGQNLMVAFNEIGSVVLGEFTLSDGADEFAAAEAEREKVDFSNLSGKLIKVDLSKPVTLAGYSWSQLLKTAKRKKRLEEILNNKPSFTVGRMFIKKSTYRYKSDNMQYYCFIGANGKQYVEECGSIDNFKDGKEVVIAYGSGCSEIIGRYTPATKNHKKSKT